MKYYVGNKVLLDPGKVQMSWSVNTNNNKVIGKIDAMGFAENIFYVNTSYGVYLLRSSELKKVYSICA